MAKSGPSRSQSEANSSQIETALREALRKDQIFVFFDGDCMLCNQFAAWVVDNDPEGVVLFAPLQGKTAEFALEEKERSALSSVIVLTKDGKLNESDGVLEIAGRLPGWQIWAQSLRLFPLSVRNIVYRVVARNRKKWFGETDQCPLPFKSHSERLFP